MSRMYKYCREKGENDLEFMDRSMAEQIEISEECEAVYVSARMFRDIQRRLGPGVEERGLVQDLSVTDNKIYVQVRII